LIDLSRIQNEARTVGWRVAGALCAVRGAFQLVFAGQDIGLA